MARRNKNWLKKWNRRADIICMQTLFLSLHLCNNLFNLLVEGGLIFYVERIQNKTIYKKAPKIPSLHPSPLVWYSFRDRCFIIPISEHNTIRWNKTISTKQFIMSSWHALSLIILTHLQLKIPKTKMNLARCLSLIH